MQQLFHTRNYSIRDFDEWNKRKELVLQPKFQRRPVWGDKARSYLIDTIIRGKPIPQIYMRQDINPKTRKTVREIVDGQQRLHTVLLFLQDGFKISRSHHPDFGGRTFSGLDQDTQRDILKYEFVVDLLQDMPDNEVFNVFARINTYAEKLKAQELRNAKYFGDFKSCVYALAEEFTAFFIANKVFTAKSVMRMAEAEFISDLLLAQQEGIQAGAKGVLDAAYKKYDDEFPSRGTHEERFREVIEIIKRIFGPDLAESEFRAIRLFYPLFCAVYHLKFKMGKMKAARRTIRPSQYPKFKTGLEYVDNLLETIEESRKNTKKLDLSAEDKRFWDAYREHWVHADKRITVADYICKKMTDALQ
jgi:Protein of unknown function DUF262